jgi:hypothetical protein
MAEVGTVYDVTPVAGTPADILPATDAESATAIPGPVARNKWLLASVLDDAASVVSQIFAEADRRDPEHPRSWVALVDGNNHQIDRIEAEARARQLSVTIVIDFIHVLEYLWKAAWCFHTEGDPAAEAWVRRHASAIRAGKATRVAGAIRRQATNERLNPARRVGADTCATYLTNKRAYLDYPTALTRGWPIATGVIEGAYRHLVKDRMDLTGARWGLPGAEAILKLRALRSGRVLELPPAPGTKTRPHFSLRQQPHPPGRMRSLQWSRTQCRAGGGTWSTRCSSKRATTSSTSSTASAGSSR